MAMGLGGLIFGGIFATLLFIALGIVTSVFWILMLVNCIKRDFKKSEEKTIWILIIIFAGVVGAIVYYFVVKKNSKK